MNTFSSVDFNPFSGQEIQKICLTNESQKEIWLSCMFGGETASLAYNQSVSLYFKGSLNLPALQKSIDDIVLRHEALRSNFSADGAKLMVYEDFPIEILVKDVSQLPQIEQKEAVKEYIRQEMSTPFNLENGPLLRACLHPLDSEHNVLILTTHHIIADGWSLNVIIEDLSNFYSIHTDSEAKKTVEEPFQISAYSIESIDFKQTKEFSDNEDFWLRWYESGVPETNTPTDFPRAETRSYQGRRLELPLSQELLPALKSLSIATECSLFSLMLSALEVFIHKTIHQNQFVMGIFSAGRPEYQHKDLVGHCVNLLPLKVEVDQHLPFIDYLKKRKGEILDAIDHQQFTFSELLKKLYIQRDAARVPLVPIVFNFDTGLGSGARFNDLEVNCLTNPREYENFELNISILWVKDTALLQFTYNKDLFKKDTIENMMKGFDFFLHEIINKPSNRIQELFIEDPKAKLDRIAERNNTDSPFSKDETLLSHVAEMVAMYPEKVAISFHEEQLTFQDLAQQSNQLAHILLDNGVKEGDKVGIALSRSPKVILSMLAILKCGAVYIPLDPEFPHDRIVYMLENSSAKVLITSTSFKGVFQSNAKELFIEECWEKLASYSIEAPKSNVCGEDLAYILYTSGSTGKPKGVQIRHYNLLNFLLSMQKEPGIKPSDKWLAITTVSFDIAGLEIFLPLISGAEIVLVDEGMSRNGAELLSIIRNQGITIMQATPATWTMMLYEGWEDRIPLKVLCGGEAFPKTLAHNLASRAAEVWNMYGPTETTIWSTVKRLSLNEERITVGRPIDNTLIYILDENQQMVPEGSAGEIYIAGDGLALGYVNRPELSLEKFIDNPFEPERSAKMYGTGDLGIALDNGEIQCLGRLDHQVKIRGYRIELGEIEHVLNKNDTIKEAIVVAREDNPDDKRLCAYVVPNLAVDEATESVLKTIWKQKLKEKLPPYMIPNDFVLLHKFPLTPNGKIDRKQLPKPGLPVIREATEQTNAAPNTPIAKTIAAVWAESLGVPEVNMGDDFFRLGGHSLLAVQLMMRLEKETGKKFPLTSLFKFSTLESFASLYEDQLSEELPPPPTTRNEDHLKGEEIIVPTIESQKEIWLSCMIGGDQANLAYNLPFALKMIGELNIDALNKSLKVIINRHEALRTNISESGESLIIHPQMALPFQSYDLSMLEEKEQEATLKTFIHKEMNLPFTLSEGALLRMYLHKLSDDAHYFTLITHHIICDGSSIDVFFDELSQLYNAYTSGHEIELPPASQISNFALDQLTFNNSSNYHLTQQYWLKQYEKEVPVLDLPVDYPRSSIRRYKGAQNEYTIGEDIFSNFKTVSQDAKCSMVTSLLSAFELFLHHQTHQNDIAIGLPVSGQTGTFYGLIGHCVNLLPLRSTIDVNETFEQYLKRRSIQLYNDYDHQKLTYSELLKRLNIKRDATRIPLIPVMFSMRADKPIALNGLNHEFKQHALAAQTFEISLYVTQFDDKLELIWVYNPDLFKKETIARFHADFTDILKHIGQTPDLKIKELIQESSKKRRQINNESDPRSREHTAVQPASLIGPRNEMEALVADIWSEYLNTPIINIKSDFFELGGHSMIAIKIMMAIEKTIGKRLPLATLFENSTIESLAKKIESDQHDSWKSLVPIKTYGNKPPLYIVHGMGMNVIAFNTLVNSMDPEQPIYGLQAKGLDPNDAPVENLEEIAQGYVQEIIENNPNGPYAIAGYSSGGTIALEMSEQLLKMNKQVIFLALIDTFYGGDSYGKLIKNKKYGEAIGQFFKFLGYGFVYLSRYPRAFIKHKVNFVLGTLYNQYKKFNPIKKDFSNPLYILDRVQKTHDKAFDNYVIKNYRTNVTLFRGNQKTMAYIPHLETNGFAPYIDGKLSVIELPIEHLNFFEPEYVDIFAQKIQEELNKCLQ